MNVLFVLPMRFLIWPVFFVWRALFLFCIWPFGSSFECLSSCLHSRVFALSNYATSKRSVIITIIIIYLVEPSNAIAFHIEINIGQVLIIHIIQLTTIQSEINFLNRAPFAVIQLFYNIIIVRLSNHILAYLILLFLELITLYSCNRNRTGKRVLECTQFQRTETKMCFFCKENQVNRILIKLMRKQYFLKRFTKCLSFKAVVVSF